jgi:hypothetical protein
MVIVLRNSRLIIIKFLIQAELNSQASFTQWETHGQSLGNEQRKAGPFKLFKFKHMLIKSRPLLWSSGQSSWLQIQGFSEK